MNRGRRPSVLFDLLTVSEVSAKLHIHQNTVRRWADQGFLKAYRIGPRGDRRFVRSEVQRFLESSPLGALDGAINGAHKDASEKRVPIS